MSGKSTPECHVLYETAIQIALRFFEAGRQIERERWEEVLRAKLQEWGYAEPEVAMEEEL